MLACQTVRVTGGGPPQGLAQVGVLGSASLGTVAHTRRNELRLFEPDGSRDHPARDGSGLRLLARDAGYPAWNSLR